MNEVKPTSIPTGLFAVIGTSETSIWLTNTTYHLGLKEEAIKCGQIAVDLEPTNERLIKNLGFYKE